MSIDNRRLRSTLDIVRSPAAHVVAVLTLGIVIRLLLYDHIAVRGDLGYWLLDGEYIIEGMRPFFDFIGRSPLFLYSYAAVRAVFGPTIAVFRWFVAILWLLSGVALYLLARAGVSHRAALVGMGLFVLSPFALAFGFYSSSQSLAVLLGAAALATLVYRDGLDGYWIAGALVALAFLSRRSFVLLGPAIVVWTAFRWRDGKVAFRRAVGCVVAFSLAFIIILFTFYLQLARGDIGATWDLFLIHFVNLFVSTGSGGVPLLSMADAVAHGNTATVNSAPPLLPLLDSRSRTAMMATLIGTLPLITPLGTYLRHASQSYLRDIDRQLIATAGVTLAAYAAYVSLSAGYLHRALWVALAVGLIALLWRTDGLPADVLYRPAITLSVMAWLWITIGYAIRPNLMAAYYAMDAIPFLIPLIGAAFVAWWDGLDTSGRGALVAVVAVLFLLSAIPLSPMTPAKLNSESRHDRVSFFTPERVQQFGADLDARGAEVVLTSQPNYVAVAEARAFERNTRALYIRKVFGNRGPMLDYYGRLIPAMQSGEVGYVVWDEANKQLLTANASALRTFKQCYDPVDTDGMYRSLNATLYKHSGC